VVQKTADHNELKVLLNSVSYPMEPREVHIEEYQRRANFPPGGLTTCAREPAGCPILRQLCLWGLLECSGRGGRDNSGTVRAAKMNFFMGLSPVSFALLAGAAITTR
jgi:hypothetical protein